MSNANTKRRPRLPPQKTRRTARPFLTPTRFLTALIGMMVLTSVLQVTEIVTGIKDLNIASALAAENATTPPPATAPAAPASATTPPAAAPAPDPKADAAKPADGKVPEAPTDAAKKPDESKAGEKGSKEWKASGDAVEEDSPMKAELLQDLAARRAALDQREKDLAVREALLQAADREMKQKLKELTGLRTKIEELLNQQSDEEKARIASLVKIYEGMKPSDAARIFDTLDLDVLVSVLTQMSERKLSPVLAAMNPERARTITVMMAQQKQLPEMPNQGQ